MKGSNSRTGCSCSFLTGEKEYAVLTSLVHSDFCAVKEEMGFSPAKTSFLILIIIKELAMTTEKMRLATMFYS